jgi:hypothetical protein
VDDRIRTGDRLDHNQELYQLSYIHRAAFKSTGPGPGAGERPRVREKPRYTRTFADSRAWTAGAAAKSISSSTGPRFSSATSRA